MTKVPPVKANFEMGNLSWIPKEGFQKKLCLFVPNILMIGGSVVGQSKVLMHDDFTVNFKNRFLSFVSLRIVPYGREHLL